MKCKALFFLFIFPALLSAQNLVPNGSFEDYVSCPEHLDGMEFVEHWYKSIIEPGTDYYQNPSPDYFNMCAINPVVGVPDNLIGSQTPSQGFAYSGLFTYDNSFSNDREVIGVQLATPLTPGQTYYCSLYYVRPFGWSALGYATNNLGMKFSNSELFTSTEQAVDNFAHLKVEEVAIDSLNWVMLYGEVVPEQSYQFLHIGNFFSDAETEVDSFNETGVWAYYFVDDIRVSSDPLVVTSGSEDREMPVLRSFPNPVNNIVTIVSSRNVRNVRIFSNTGKLIVELSTEASKIVIQDLSHINTGLYVAVVYFENGEYSSIKINKN